MALRVALVTVNLTEADWASSTALIATVPEAMPDAHPDEPNESLTVAVAGVGDSQVTEDVTF
jgi:hypothetical protein